MMDPDIKAKWLEALRSGKYQQAREKLYDRGSYCCLGVLCRAIGAEFQEFNEPDDDRYYDNAPVLDGINLADSDAQELSRSFLRRVGLSEEVQGRLIIMNDDQQAPFLTIAEYIEKSL
jgi:hypothetical protein